MPVDHALDSRYLSKGQDGISFTIAELTKTAQPGKRKKVYYPQLKEERTLCPVAALDEYLRRTSSMRGADHPWSSPSNLSPNPPLLDG